MIGRDLLGIEALERSDIELILETAESTEGVGEIDEEFRSWALQLEG